MFRNDMQFRHQLGATGTGLEVPGAGREIVVLNIDDVHTFGHRPRNGRIDMVDNLSVILGNVILQVDHNQRLITHHFYSSVFLSGRFVCLQHC